MKKLIKAILHGVERGMIIFVRVVVTPKLTHLIFHIGIADDLVSVGAVIEVQQVFDVEERCTFGHKQRAGGVGKQCDHGFAKLFQCLFKHGTHFAGALA